MGKEQSVLIARSMREEAARQRRRANLMNRYFVEGVAAVIAIFAFGFFVMGVSYVVQDRIEKYPHLGTGWIPKSEEQRRREAEPKVWIGR
jgi:hypothetical protein